MTNSRVHITKTTLDHLGDKFEVEPGGGASREAYLADHKVETYLIIPPKVKYIQQNFIIKTFKIKITLTMHFNETVKYTLRHEYSQLFIL